MNIVDPILFQARFQPEAPALCSLGNDVITYARLRAQMNSIARRAMSCGIRRGDIVALSIDDPLLHSAVILGLTQAGIVSVSLVGSKPPEGLRIDAVISNGTYPFAQHARHLPLDASWTSGEGAATEPAGDVYSESDEICRIILTSGSTGEPKAVAVTHRLAMAHISRFEYLLGNRQSACSRIFLNIGIAAMPGYNFLTFVLGRGGTIFFRGDSVESTLRSFEIFQIQSMAATPATLAQLLAACDQQPSINVHVDSIFLAGSAVPPALLERVRPRLCSHVFSRYGTTESGAAATAPADRIAHIPGAVGYVTPGVRIEIVDEADRPLPAGTEGIVRIASDFAVDRYFDDPADAAPLLRNGWFYPGDIGSVTADNLVIISGRQNDVLNVGGSKTTTERIEFTLVSFKGVNEAAVFTATGKLGVDEVWAAVVCREKVDPEGLRAHCRSRLPAVFVPAHIVPLDAFPINAMNKVDRPRLKELVLAAARL